MDQNEPPAAIGFVEKVANFVESRNKIIMKILKTTLLLFSCLILAACQSKKSHSDRDDSESDRSDPETEAQIFGEWRSTEFEDDVMIGENVSFFPDHTFKIEVGTFASDFTPLFSISGSGEWYASEDELTMIADVETIGMTYINSSAIDLGTVQGIVQDMRRELKEPQISKIVSIGPDSSGDIGMTLEDDGETTTYAKVESFEPEADEVAYEEEVVDYPSVEEGAIHAMDVKYLSGAQHSVLNPHKESTYVPQNAFDGNKATCWAMDVKKIEDERDRLINVKVYGTALRGLNIYNGYQKSESLYKKNNRPRNILIAIADPDNYKLIKKKFFEGQLKDTFGAQYIALDPPVSINGETISIFIEDWYEGDAYKDHICISEIEFLGD